MSDSPARQLFASLRTASQAASSSAPAAFDSSSTLLASSFSGFGLGAGGSSSVGGTGGGGVLALLGSSRLFSPVTQGFASSASHFAGFGGPRSFVSFADPPVLRADNSGKVTFFQPVGDLLDDDVSRLGVASSFTTVPCFNSFSGSVGLVWVSTVELDYCGALIGSTGRFCLHPHDQCPIKTHQKAPNHFEDLVCSSDVKSALYICWLTALSPSAYCKPYLDTCFLSTAKPTELLALTKPVPMWSALFTLLEAAANSKLESATGKALPDLEEI